MNLTIKCKAEKCEMNEKGTCQNFKPELPKDTANLIQAHFNSAVNQEEIIEVVARVKECKYLPVLDGVQKTDKTV